MFRSLHMKLTLILLLLITSLMAVVGTFLTTSVSSFFIDSFYQQMDSVFGAGSDFYPTLCAGAEEGGAARLQELVEDICHEHHCTCEISYKCGNTLVNNDPALARMASKVAAELLGPENIQSDRSCMTMGGDDFAEFMRRAPGVYYYVGSGDPEKKTDTENHNPKFLLDEDALSIGAEMQLSLTWKYLSE